MDDGAREQARATANVILDQLLLQAKGEGNRTALKTLCESVFDLAKEHRERYGQERTGILLHRQIEGETTQDSGSSRTYSNPYRSFIAFAHLTNQFSTLEKEREEMVAHLRNETAYRNPATADAYFDDVIATVKKILGTGRSIEGFNAMLYSDKADPADAVHDQWSAEQLELEEQVTHFHRMLNYRR